MDPDASYSEGDASDVDEVFDVEGGGYATERTDPEDDCDEELEYDVEDQIRLFAGNTLPPEYFRQGMQDFNEEELAGKDHAPSTQLLMEGVKELWHRYSSNLFPAHLV